MKTRVFVCAFLMLMACFVTAAQQQTQPLTFWYEYHVAPGKEEDFLNLIKTDGQPVRDKLMEEGVVIARMTEEAAKGSSGKKGAAASAGPMEQIRAITDFAKTHDYLTRDLVQVLGPTMPPAGTLPWVRYNFSKVKPGKAADYRKAWEKYNKPVFDKMVADGTLLAFGFSVEDVRTDGDFTHYVWLATKD